MSRSPLGHRMFGLAQIALAVGLLVYLVRQAVRHEGFARLVQEPKDWRLLMIAFVATTTAVALSFIRWYLLIRTLELPVRFREVFRLGCLGYLFNFIALGSVGGDLFKAFFLARNQPGRRTEAVATVVIDRLVGLYALLLVSCGTIWWTDLGNRVRGTVVAVLCDVTILCMLLGAIGFCLLLIPGFTGGRATTLAGHLPAIGHHVVRLIETIRIYRRRLPAVFVAAAMSLGVHSLLVLAVYCIAVGLPGDVPSLGEHFFIVPLSMVAAAIPITPNGLGTFEGTLEILYRIVPAIVPVQPGTGTLVALGYRLTTLGAAAIGAVSYFTSRQEVDAMIHDAEKLSDAVSPGGHQDATPFR
ncbi:MAG: flippase-like domain-containing protein [Pirellulales bacterium]|nr:flippase-like domain-containing protein [Pirellulales bacterium]